MNKLALLIFGFSTAFLFSQEEQQEDRYFFHVSIPNFESLEITKNQDGTLEVFSLESRQENEIYNQYKVFALQRAFPNTQKENLQMVYRLTTDNRALLEKLQLLNPIKYSKIGEYFPPKIEIYPNDYGTTSPVENLGAPYPLNGLDLINAPGAWGITKGNKKVVIGISDARVDSTNADLQGRISNYLKYLNVQKGITCSHGTNVAGIIGARSDNAFGMPGICSECDMITNGYGQFDYIIQLVEAGAKVINASWVLCGFGAYHKNVEERINEYYDEGILIVAGAGNKLNCNPNLKDKSSNYGYPASFKRVISVTTVFADCENWEDCIIADEKSVDIILDRYSDRHVRRHKVVDGKIIPINLQWANQHNLAVDIAAPADTFLLGSADCEMEDKQYGGASSSSAAVVTGVIGLIWSANYCLGSAEVESIMKLTAADIENLPGNEPFKMLVGAGRIDAFKAVKMADAMQQEKGEVEISGRDFYRFEFVLKSAPYMLKINNQTFRDSSTVTFKARKGIHLQPNTHLKPDQNGFVKLSIDPGLPTGECFPKVRIPKPALEKDTVSVPVKSKDPVIIEIAKEISGLLVRPVEQIMDSEYEVEIKADEKVVFRKKYAQTEVASIALENIQEKTVTVTITSTKYKMTKKIRINYP